MVKIQQNNDAPNPQNKAQLMLVRMWGKGIHPLGLGMQTCTATMEISVVFPQEAGNSRSIYTVLGHKPKDCTSYSRDSSSTVFIAVPFIIDRNGKQPSCLSVDGWTKKI